MSSQSSWCNDLLKPFELLWYNIISNMIQAIRLATLFIGHSVTQVLKNLFVSLFLCTNKNCYLVPRWSIPYYFFLVHYSFHSAWLPNDLQKGTVKDTTTITQHLQNSCKRNYHCKQVLLQLTSEQMMEHSLLASQPVSKWLGQLVAKLGQNEVLVHPGEEVNPIFDPSVWQQPRTLSSC